MNDFKLVRKYAQSLKLYEFQKVVSLGTMTKNIPTVSLDRNPPQRVIRMLFGRFRQGVLKLNAKNPYRRTSDVDEYTLLDIVVKKMKISTEVISKRLKITISNAFQQRKRLFSRQTTNFDESNWFYLPPRQCRT